MSDQITNEVLPSESQFVTVFDAGASLDDTIALAPTGGKRFGIATSYISTFALTTPIDQATEEWRIGISIEIPRFATWLFGLLASWGIPGSRRRVEFVVKAKANAVTIGGVGEQKHRAHKYTVLNGSFQSERGLSTEMKVAKPFRDRKARMWYGTAFDSTDFNEVLDVILSELTGAPAFPA